MIQKINRLGAETIHGAIIHFVADGDTIERDGESVTVDATTLPTLDEALAHGKCLGQIYQWKWGVTYKTLTRKGVYPPTQRHTTRDSKILQGVKPTFATQDVNLEALALEYGLKKLPAQGTKVVPFTNAAGCLPGWLFIQVVDSYRTTGSDGNLINVRLRGELGLQDGGSDNVDDLKDVPFEFPITDFSACEFENVGIDVA